MTPTTPSREDWERRLRNDVFPFGIWHDHPSGYERRVEYMKDFIDDIIQNHNNALVAEIEKEKERSTPPGHCGRMGKGQKCESCAEMNGRVRALDTIIRIIQEK